MSEISETTSSFTVDVWFSAIWNDYRLALNHLDPCIANLSLDYQMAEKLWSPNVCFANSKEVKVHSSPHENILLLIFHNGTVWLNHRVRVVGPCDMDLTFFPFGNQFFSDILVANLNIEICKKSEVLMLLHSNRFISNFLYFIPKPK